MNSHKADLSTLASLLMSLIYGFYILYIVVTPLYSFSGVVTGEIAISWYKLEMDERKIHISALDAIRILAFPLYTLGSFATTIGTIGTYIALRRSRLKQVVIEMNLAVSLSAIIYSALIVQLGRLVSREAKHLDIDLVYTNNAGTVNFGQTEVYRHTAIMLLEPGQVILITAVYIFLTIIALVIPTDQEIKKS